MTRRGLMQRLAGAISTMALAGCNLFGNEARYRFRMTIEVNTSRGVKTGSSVMEINAYKEPIIIGDRGGGHSGIRGEAVMIHLPDGPVFALLTTMDAGPQLAGIVTQALAPETKAPDFNLYLDAVRRLGNAREGEYRADIPQQALTNSSGISKGQIIWPMMIRFSDIKDPSTIEKIDPDKIGVKRIYVVTTRSPITTGIDKILMWLPDVYKLLKGKNFQPDGIPVGNFQGLFSSEHM